MFKETDRYRNCETVYFMPGLKPEQSPNPRMMPLSLDTSVTKIEKGTCVKEGSAPILCDIIYEKDQPVRLRDGVTIYVDVFRPDDDAKHPVILAWTPYGKINPPNHYAIYFNNADMDDTIRSGLDSFECPDPNYWVSQDYILIVADSRGSTNSEGAMRYWGTEEAYDIYDTIEWAAGQTYCNGNVGMAGNSWLAICQYFTAALQPPHLKAIAPWEGSSDMYHDTVCRGGIPTADFCRGITNMLRLGEEGIEDVGKMLEEHPDYDDYWKLEKRPDFGKISIPAYFVASYSSIVHPAGSIRAYNMIASEKKWLRIHNTQEWRDQYTPKYRNELKEFFDCYLKNADNDWEQTPKVRISILDETGPDTVEKVVDSFPIEDIPYEKLYLDASCALTKEMPQEGTVAYDVKPDSTGNVVFRHRFEKDTELAGYFKLKLFMSTDSGDDMDVFVFVSKEDETGIPYRRKVLGVEFMGASGRVRASRREVDPENKYIYDFKYKYDHDDPISPGQVVEMEIVTWPLSMRWRKGEILTLTVSAGDIQKVEFPAPPCATRNQGTHTIYTGGDHASCLEVPVL